MGRWTSNGRELFNVAKDYGLKLQNTFGAKRAEQLTWRHPSGGLHWSDFFCVRLATRADRALLVCSAPVSCGGFRDHRPLVILVPAQARVKRVPPSQHPHAWDRSLISRSLEAWRAWSTSSTAGAPRDPLVDEAMRCATKKITYITFFCFELFSMLHNIFVALKQLISSQLHKVCSWPYFQKPK